MFAVRRRQGLRFGDQGRRDRGHEIHDQRQDLLATLVGRFIYGGETVMKELPRAQDKPLFTPGPLTTSMTVKQAMLRDLGSRDYEFMATVRQVRRQLLAVAGVAP